MNLGIENPAYEPSSRAGASLLLGHDLNVELQNNDRSSLSNEWNNNESINSVYHCHDGSSKVQVDKKARRKLLIASAVCLVFMLGEIIGGALAGSLAILTDGAHMLTDFASFMISLFALYLSARPATKTMSFGWQRAEVLGALISVLMIWLLTGILVYLAVERIKDPTFKIDGKIMLITAGVGVAMNIVMGMTLHQHGHSHGGGGHGHSHGGGGHGHSHGGGGHEHSHGGGGHGHSHGGGGHGHSHRGDGHEHSQGEHKHGHSHGGSGHEDNHENQNQLIESRDIISEMASVSVVSNSFDVETNKSKVNLNVRAAFIHVIGDFFQSIGVLIASFIIYYKPEWKIADPICTFIFSILVLFTTITILKDTLIVLMEGTPKDVKYSHVKSALLDVHGVKRVHNLHIWSLTTSRSALAVHLDIENSIDQQDILKTTTQIIKGRFSISDVTIQIEKYEKIHCFECEEPSN